MTRLTYDEAQDIASSEYGRVGLSCGRRITLGDGRRATVVSEYACVADVHHGYVHVDGTPAGEESVAHWTN